MWLGFVGWLSVLEVLCVWWFGLIAKVVLKVITGNNADDVRSDDEDDKED
jgi:acyl-CoA-dependent ceramide synthase